MWWIRENLVASFLHHLKGLQGDHLPPPLRKTMLKKGGRRAELSWHSFVPILQWQRSLPLTSPSSKSKGIRWEVYGETKVNAKIWWLRAIIPWCRSSCTLTSWTTVLKAFPKCCVGLCCLFFRHLCSGKIRFQSISGAVAWGESGEKWIMEKVQPSFLVISRASSENNSWLIPLRTVT